MEMAQYPESDGQRTIAFCQRALRVLTAVILSAFALIIAMTTVSTGGFVQVTAKGLYYVIVLSAVVSLGTWLWRVRTERRCSHRSGATAGRRGQEG